MDPELFVSNEMRELLNEKGILVKPSSAHQQSLNGAAKCLGSVIKDKSQAMRKVAKLPNQLWSEITQAAVYLHN